ncbi:ATP-binding protein [Bdellovibrio sp. HCB337]|uniref:PAS domain-containing sensor histidine kinase n=1 Tax=Bdellovibrio sp. HCB337 TaxID=3394358 RepID=UPI0039A7806C
MKKDSIIINNVPFEWNAEGRGYTFFGLDAITFWTRPSLVSILGSLRNEIGAELYALIIGFEASKGTYEDYHSMVNTLGSDFKEGFLSWGRAVSGAGWGSFSVLSIDFDNKEAVVQIDDPWEMRIFKADNIQDAVPFLNGKISGIFTHAFKTNCRCEVIEAINETSGPRRAILKVRPSNESLEHSLLHSQTNRDVHEQLKAANIALRRNQQRLTDTLDTIGERIWETDAQMIIRYASNVSISSQNRSSQAIVGTSILKYVHPEDVTAFQNACTQAQKDATSVLGVKVRYFGKSGETLWAYFRFKSLLDISGKHGGFLGSMRDITSEMALQQQLSEQQERSIQSAKMASLGEMAAGIAHEINNPLTEIIGNAWHLRNLNKKGELKLEDFDEALDSIENMSRRISEIIKGMRLFSRETSEDPFRPTALSNVIEETLVFCKKRFINHGVQLNIVNETAGLEIDCRASQVSQVLLNLLNNAFDAIASSDQKWIEIKIDTVDEFARIQVIDSGPGIPKEIAKKLMQPFFTTKGPGKGTGLGLSISRGIIESHQGKLFLNPEGPNTRFVVLLPKKQTTF